MGSIHAEEDLSKTQKGGRVDLKGKWLFPILGLILGVLMILPWVSSKYVLSVVFMMLVYIGYAVAWNLMSGLTGYINFGYSIFIGIASYVSVILIMDYRVWWPIAWILGGASVIIVAVAIGSFMLKLKGSYFAIGMLALLIGIKIMFSSKYLTPITRGGFGFSFLEPLSVNAMYYAVFFIMVLTVLVSQRVITSSFGARLIAIREDEEGAESLGINTTADKIKAFGLSAFLGGLMACGHFAFQNYIDPDSAFSGNWTLVPMVMVLLGGLGSLWGPVIGAVILTFVEEFLWSHFEQAYMMIYGFIMVLLVLLMPGGIIEWLKNRGTLQKIRNL